MYNSFLISDSHIACRLSHRPATMYRLCRPGVRASLSRLHHTYLQAYTSPCTLSTTSLISDVPFLPFPSSSESISSHLRASSAVLAFHDVPFSCQVLRLG